jgi:COP9 signalosome complex subunit 2
MSDDEGSYEYDDDADEDMEDNFEYTDEEEEADDAEVALENAYYNAKGLRETDLNEAAQALEGVITSEQEELKSEGKSYTAGPWSFKALKQLVKLHLRTGNANEVMRHYHRLLECVAEGEVSPNAVEKGINGMLDRISSLFQGTSSRNAPLQADPHVFARDVYEATLKIFHPKTGASPNERLWFKTNIKYGQLLYELNETAKLQFILKDLKDSQESNSDETSGTSTQFMEIYALQIQLYSRQKDNKKLREVFNKAVAVRGGIPHPRTLALIQELGGKMHMAAREYDAAGKTFFQAFKSYDEAGDPNRLKCLKYLVMASMLDSSTINPFDSQEARPYRDDPEIVAMTNLVQAFHNNEIQTFERILRQNQGRIMDDEFVREHVEDLLRTIRTQVLLRRVIRPYTRISLLAIAKELNDIPVSDVESLLVSLILDGKLDGEIDQVEGVLLKKAERGSSGAEVSSQNTSTKAGRSLEEQKCAALEEMADALERLSATISSVRVKDPHQMRGMVH